MEDFDLDNILTDKKSQENTSIYGSWYKILIYPEPLHIRFDKIGGSIRTYNGTRYLTLFGSEKDDAM